MVSVAPKRYTITGKLADLSFLIFSMFDTIMDIIILITWHNEDKMTFFGIGTSFVIISQLSYYYVFHMIHHGDSPKDMIPSMLATLPCIPCLQIIWTLVAESDSCLRRIFCCDIEWEHLFFHCIDPRRQWIENLSLRNALYSLHAFFESSPQCILQIVAMYYYKQTNNIFLSISILSSILMICSQCYILLLMIDHV